jgi:hypothetical protein
VCIEWKAFISGALLGLKAHIRTTVADLERKLYFHLQQKNDRKWYMARKRSFIQFNCALRLEWK